jgi:hypothetical protein
MRGQDGGICTVLVRRQAACSYGNPCLPVDLLLCNDSIKVFLGSKLAHKGIKHNNLDPSCTVAELDATLAELEYEGFACTGCLGVACATSGTPLLTLSPVALHCLLMLLAQPPDTVNTLQWTVCRCLWPCHCTGRRNGPPAPSSPNKALPSHPHPTMGGRPLPTATTTTMVERHIILTPMVLSPSLLPTTFRTRHCLSQGGGDAHPFRVCGMTLPPQKCTQHKHHLHCVCQQHCPRAPDPQEHLLCG